MQIYDNDVWILRCLTVELVGVRRILLTLSRADLFAEHFFKLIMTTVFKQEKIPTLMFQ
jgi:hypothetical protein